MTKNIMTRRRCAAIAMISIASAQERNKYEENNGEIQGGRSPDRK